MSGFGQSGSVVSVSNQMSDESSVSFSQNLVWIDSLQLITASGELFNHVDASLPMWAGSGDRIVRVRATFTVPFSDTPCVNVGLNGLDAAHDQNLRFRLDTVDVTPFGFVIEFVTWGDTHIARACVSWQAIGSSAGRQKTRRKQD
ncbi:MULTISPECIES: H-type lectin domain-containing protein [Paracoccus]|uniref:H-type lectin domain-containing protein n=1 Tax=Paracoccus kondratievae TaxID=135740 RepID=A0AAD3P0M7_9RHOB|nr:MULTISPECIES: H-type lectin domain-containing protein [Paracoccus]GLK65422.1 hypothetical protein GCM10017635_28970 [Paracoccus kondratievae]